MTDAQRALLERQSLKPVISTEATTREELRSTQEEADARCYSTHFMQQQQDKEPLSLRQKKRTCLFSLWLLKASYHVLCLLNAAKRL